MSDTSAIGQLKLSNSDLVQRYILARAMIKDLANQVIETIATRATFLRCADRLALRYGDQIECANETETTLLMDFVVYADLYRGHSAATRFLKRRRKSLTDEQIGYLEAMSKAHYSIFVIEEVRSDLDGQICFDLLTERQWFVVDRMLAASAKPGMELGGRMIDQGDYAMFSGAALLTDREILDDFYYLCSLRLREQLVKGCVHLSTYDQSVLQRLVIRDAVLSGATGTMSYA